MQEFYNRFGLRRVLNARGPATALGASRVSEKVRKDVFDILGLSVEIWELQRRASEAIVKLTGAEAGVVVGCTAAGIAIAAAATLTGDDIAKIKQLPTITGPKNKIVIQKGHVVGAGDAPITQVLRMTGAEVIEIGEALDCAKFHLEAALTPDVAAAVYVMLDVFPPNLLPVDTFIRICKAKNVPVIVDAAYDINFRHLIEMGADLVIYSGHKWLGAPTSALIAGRKDLVHACYLQEMGIGRPMKVGKEGILGLISAIESWLERDEEAIIRRQTAFAKRFIARLREEPGIEAEIRRTQFSPSVRVEVRIDEKITGVPAWEINYKLGIGNPVIKMDDYAVHQGKLTFDLSYLDDGDEDVIADAIFRIIRDKRENKSRSSKQLEPMTRMDLLLETVKKWQDPNPRGE